MPVEVTRAQLDKLSKYNVEVYPLTGTDTAELAIEDRYEAEREHDWIPFRWLLRSLLRCQAQTTIDEQPILRSLCAFFTAPIDASPWRRSADDEDSYLEVDTQAWTVLLRRARDACHPVEGQPDGGGVLDARHDELVLELKVLNDVIAMMSAVPASTRTMLALRWGA
ncbi:MAG TPA: hypothetical protein VGM39_24115 [Kofleriaceae bacterium]|jgi:hypothetical protein